MFSPIKMAGSKRRMMAKIEPLIPHPSCSTGKYVIPFAGTCSDALVFDENYEIRVLADRNEHLVMLYRALAHPVVRTETLAEARAWLARTRIHRQLGFKEEYAKLRAAYNQAPAPWMFLLLTRLSFNGLIRFNAKGKFNTPAGVSDVSDATMQQFEEFGEWLETQPRVEPYDFETSCELAEPGDVVYLDPPYLGTFDSYTSEGFDTERLVATLRKLSDKCITWALSNSQEFAEKYNPESLGDPDRIITHEIQRSGTFSSKGTARGKVTEILWVHIGT